MALEQLLDDVIRREQDDGEPDVEIHLGYGIFGTMSKKWKNVSLRRWFDKVKAIQLRKLHYKDEMGVYREKKSITFRGMELVAGGINTDFIICFVK